MIYLIGGSPRGGKSILSRKLSKKLNVPYISTDNLRLVVLPYFKRNEKNKNFPFIRMYESVSTDEFFRRYSGQEMLKADLIEAKAVWPGLKSLINHLLVCKMDYIIEGIHLLPSFVKEFKDNKNIRIVFLNKTTAEKIHKGLLSNKNNSDWLMDNAKNKETILISAKAFCEYGKYFIRETKKYRYKCFNTEENFNEKIKEGMAYLENI